METAVSFTASEACPTDRQSPHAEDHVPQDVHSPLSLSKISPATGQPAPALVSEEEAHAESLVDRHDALADYAAADPHDYDAAYADYFSPDARASHSVRPEHHRTRSAPINSLSRQTTRESQTSTTDLADFSRLDNALTRHLSAQREAVAEVSETNASAPAPSSPGLVRSNRTEHPSYPEQSLAALQSQVYPPNHPAPYASRPASRHQPSSSANQLAHYPPRDIITTDRESKTVGSTPIQTPHLFAPRAIRPGLAYENGDEHSPFPSPYLHPVQTVVPKETKVANREVDTYSGRKCINQYEILWEIGRGSHGKVKLARNLETGENVAIKIVSRFSKKRRLGKPTSTEDKVKREIAILKKAVHPNIVSMLEVIDDPEINKIYLVLEFCDAHEVRWRTLGSSEIVLMESRRLNREMRGEDSSSPPSDAIMRAAASRRERETRRRPVLSRVNSETEFWSLEYSGETDEEDLDPICASEPISRVVSRALHDRDHIMESDPTEATPTRTTLVERSPWHDDASGPITPRASDEERLAGIVFRDTDLGSGAHESRSLSDFGSFPSFDTDSRPRKSSVAESTVSRITDIMESEIPEDFRYVPCMTLGESRSAFRDALLGLEYLHYQGVVHRDIKPENLLRKSDKRVKISDFGVSYLGKPIRDGKESGDVSESESTDQDHDEETELAKTVGSPAFFAPELCSLDISSKTPVVTGQIDVWALGVTLYCLLFARTPFTANNEFALMRKIAEDEVFIPRRRLKAVDSQKPGIRAPTFHEREHHRLPWQLLYEDIDDDLYDLMKRLLIKDPTRRITIKEIKHHPWILRDIATPENWQEETDPARFTQGKKIEISKEEVAEAVIPLKLIERVKSVVKKAQGVLMGGSRTTRRRGQSSATSSEAGSSISAPPTANPTTKSKSGVNAGETLATLNEKQRSDQSGHPLAQSVTASPEPRERPMEGSSRFSSSDRLNEGRHSQQRPALPDRQASQMSTAASVKTLRQSDISQHHLADPPPPLPLFPSPDAIERPGSVTLGTLLGDAGRSLMRTMRTQRRDGSETRSTSRPSSIAPSESSDHLHGEPSTAVSNTIASGRVSVPQSTATDSVTNSALTSPKLPSSPSTTSHVGARIASPSLTSSLTNSPMRNHLAPVDLGGGLSKGSPYYTTARNDDATDAEYQLAMEQSVRRRYIEDERSRERSIGSRPQSSLVREVADPCPTSPDDVSFRRDNTIRGTPSYLQLSYSSSPKQSFSHHVASSASSEEPMHSGISQSTSFPSNPSVMSAVSSVDPETDVMSKPKVSPDVSYYHRPSGSSSGIRPLILTSEDDDGYSGDHAVDTDEDDSEPEEFLMMNRKKAGRGASVHSSAAAGRRPSRLQERHQIGGKRASRSGSTNTMKKVRSHEASPGKEETTPTSTLET